MIVSMDAKLLFLVLCFIVSLQFSFSASRQVKSLESVPDLEKLMYTVVDGYPCVRLLSLSGEIGCSNPGREKVVAPVVDFKKANELTKSSALLVSLDEFKSFFARLETDANFAKHVAGVLLESKSESQNELKGLSPDKKFPQSDFAPYQNQSYEWNPSGSGIMWKAYNFPVFLLSEDSISTLRKVASKNENRKNSYNADVAEFDLVMQTTKSGTHDSESCLQEGVCLPLGGYSVWSALRPIDVLQKPKPIILVMASMDSSSFFRDKSLGADSPISGLISLLAAADALSRLSGLSDSSKQIVFVVFTGEAWGYLGSRRFLHELDQHDLGVDGLDLGMLEMVIEIGSVGKSSDNGMRTFFAHTTGESTATNITLDALKHAQDSLENDSIKILMANTSNPGIPPSSLMTFLKKKPQTSGVVLEDFDTSFANNFYHSHFDDILNVNSSTIAAAASLVARTLYILALDKKEMDAFTLNAISVNRTLVDELLGCLLNCEPGLQCELVKNYISPSTTCPSNYVGVILGEPSFAPHPGYVLDVPRFVWNFLADKTSLPSKNTSSSCPKYCSGTGEVCIHTETDGQGSCVLSTTRYFPAYSMRLKYESGNWKVLPSNSSDIMGEADPVWTESNWNTIGLRVYTMQDVAYDNLIFLLGIVVTVASYVSIVITRAFITKALKQD